MTAWVFEVSTDQGVSGTLTVHQESGRWAQVIDAGGKLGRSVHAYDATFQPTSGEGRIFVVTSKDLRWLRRVAKAD